MPNDLGDWVPIESQDSSSGGMGDWVPVDQAPAPAPRKPSADLSKIQTSPYEKAILQSGGVRPESGMESGTDFTSALATDAARGLNSVRQALADARSSLSLDDLEKGSRDPVGSSKVQLELAKKRASEQGQTAERVAAMAAAGERMVEPLTGRGMLSQPYRLAGLPEPFPSSDKPMNIVTPPKGDDMISGLGQIEAGLINTIADPNVLVPAMAGGASPVVKALFAGPMAWLLPESVKQSSETLGDIGSTPAQRTAAIVDPAVQAGMIALLSKSKAVPEFDRSKLPVRGLSDARIAEGAGKPDAVRGMAVPLPESNIPVPSEGFDKFPNVKVPAVSAPTKDSQVSVSDIAKMTPDQVVEWKKKAGLGQQHFDDLGAQVKPDEHVSLLDEQGLLEIREAELKRKLNVETWDDARHTPLQKEMQNIGIKLHVIRGILEKAPKFDPNEFVPAIKDSSGNVIEGKKGQSHQDIYNDQGEGANELRLSVDPDSGHGFSRNGKFYSKDQVTKILKEKNTVDSQRLSELQKEFKKPARSNAEIAAQGDKAKAKAIADLQSKLAEETDLQKRAAINQQIEAIKKEPVPSTQAPTEKPLSPTAESVVPAQSEGATTPPEPPAISPATTEPEQSQAGVEGVTALDPQTGNPLTATESLLSRVGQGEPRPAGMGGATPSEFPKAPSKVKVLWNKMVAFHNKTANTLKTLLSSRSVRDAMSFTRDSGDNAATIFGRSMANETRNEINNSFPKNQRSMAENALSFVVESQGNPDALAEMRQKVVGSENASDTWKKKAFDAIDFALYNFDKLKPIADLYKSMTDAQITAENGAGIDTLSRNGYVMHAQDISGSEAGHLSGGSSGIPTSFKKVRTHETFADSIAAGVDPKTLNAIDLLESRLVNGQRMINNRNWVKGLSEMTDPQTKMPVAKDPIIVKRADGTTYPQAPEGYSLEHLGFQPVAIHNGYEGVFSALTDPSWFSKNAGARSLLKANAVGKSVNLMLDTFHLGRISMWQSLVKSLGIDTFKAPVPSYREGITLLDNTVPAIKKMAERGEIPQSWMPEMLENKRRLDLAVKNGFNVGGISDAMHQDWIRSVPIIGTFNKFLFTQFQRGAMSEVWLLEFQRLKNARPGLSENEAARMVSKDMNIRFGNLGRQGILKSKTAQDAVRLLALAPQWNEGLIRSELGALKQAGEAAIDVAKGKTLYSGVLLRSVGAMAVGQFAANQIINMYTRGKPTWENPEEGIGAKLSAWIPDKIGKGPGFFLHPLGLAAETTHLLMTKYEKTADFRKTLRQYLISRSSAAMKPVLTFLTNQDILGKTIKPGGVWWEMVNSAVPTPIGSQAIYAAVKQAITGNKQEAFPGQVQKQMMASVGVKTDQAPSYSQRIRSLAHRFNTEKGITPAADFYQSDYQELSDSLRTGNMETAKSRLKDLMTKKTRQQIWDHYMNSRNRPFTGSESRENQFRKTLSPEQKEAYKKAKQENYAVSKQAMSLLRTLSKKPDTQEQPE